MPISNGGNTAPTGPPSPKGQHPPLTVNQDPPTYVYNILYGSPMCTQTDVHGEYRQRGERSRGSVAQYQPQQDPPDSGTPGARNRRSINPNGTRQTAGHWGRGIEEVSTPTGPARQRDTGGEEAKKYQPQQDPPDSGTLGARTRRTWAGHTHSKHMRGICFFHQRSSVVSTLVKASTGEITSANLFKKSPHFAVPLFLRAPHQHIAARSTHGHFAMPPVPR
jgi:hypothetical protein